MVSSSHSAWHKSTLQCDSSINAWLSWQSSTARHLKRRNSSIVTIHKVPERLRRRENDAYEPRIISFGPYHHGKPGLQAMENEEFVEMMLIDGCFLVGYLLQFYYGGFPSELDNIVGMHDLIRYDILLLENQLPFFVPIKIFELLKLTTPSPFPSSFMDLAINYLNCWVGEEKVDFQPPESFHHLLHLSHSHCLYTSSASVLPAAFSVTNSEEESGPIHRPQPPSATVLHEAGVKFEKKEVNGSSSLDVTFDNGKMMIPPLVIDSLTSPDFETLSHLSSSTLILTSSTKVSPHMLNSWISLSTHLRILHRGLNLIDELGKEKGLSCLFLILELVISRCIVSMKKWV
ncbi:UPF0481-like protein [Cinnamomum micranthum f. kanehirae]|uniref:UPF0481-like protein n=1 Tax=Cinnamomum micranthum f. kanehirae TaxID=337451 RepID=A0A443Q1U2_9MAGN|nr:UPF0481-like protein [Cinnamomum micranthum f. kanehirae]